MTPIIAGVILSFALVIGIVPLLLTVRFKTELARLMTDTPPVPAGKVAAIIPCKGIDQGFRDNIRAFLNQNHPDLDLIFVVATDDDPARAEILAMLEEHGRTGPANVRASLHVAGIENVRAQKLTNQLHGLSKVPEQSGFLAFLDSDLRPDPGFIGRLIAPLQSQSVGATTGFRWYDPAAPNLGSILRSAWNAGALPLLTNPKTVFAFGGAMAMRTDEFKRAKIGEAWDRALSDDFPLTLGVKNLGLEIRFVPSCIAVSYEHSTMAETVEFTNRQSIISRIYFPPLWLGAALAHSLSVLILIAGLVGAYLALTSGGLANLLLSACLAIIPLQCANAAMLLEAIPPLLPAIGDHLHSLRRHYIFSAPLATVLSFVNTVFSMTTRQIVWRGIRYELVSPVETRIL